MKKNKIIKFTEQEMLNKLNIPDWRHMNKDCIMEFASNMQYLDPEVAKRAIEQFPKFSELGIEITKALKESLTEICESENKSVKKAFEINEQILDNLNKRLNKPFLFPGERKKIIDAMVEVSKHIVEIQDNHGHITLEMLKQMTAVLTGIIVLAAAILGIKINNK